MMRVDMIELEARAPEGRELCLDFRGELLTRSCAHGQFDAGPDEVAAQSSSPVHEIGNALRRQNRRPVDEHQVQTDAQRGQAARSRHRVGSGPCAHHQAGGRQDALRVRELNGLVDLGRKAEIVRCDYETVQCAASRRSRRKWKNSMPSRSRRFIISGLFTISPTIDAILSLRK